MPGPLVSGALISLSMLLLLLLRGSLCFFLGVANIPGFRLWKAATAQANRNGQRQAVLVGWLCQSVASVFIVVLLLFLAKFLFEHLYVSDVLKVICWIFFLYIGIAPAYTSRKLASQSETLFDWPYYKLTLAFTMITTAVTYIVLLFIW
jgi:hypothetical protein